MRHTLTTCIGSFALVALLSLACSDDTDEQPPGGADSQTNGDDVDEDMSADPEPDVARDGGDSTTDDAAADGPAEIEDAPGDAEDDSDAAGPVNEFPTIAHTVPPPGENPDGHPDVTEVLGPGHVRAGRITSWETSFGGQDTDCRRGDFKIYNSRVQFCIADFVPIAQYTLSGGQLIDADFAGETNDRFYLLVPQSGLSLPGADVVEVLADGRDGEAVVAVRGPEEPIWILARILGTNLFPPRGVSFETEYRLRPDVDYLEIITWVRVGGADQKLTLGDVVLFGDTSSTFTPDFGRDWPAASAPLEFAAATTLNRSYGLYRPGGMNMFSIDLTAFSDQAAAMLPINEASGLAPTGEEGVFRRYFIVGDGGTDSIREAIADIEERSLPNQTARFVVTELSAPAESVSLLVGTAEQPHRDVVVTDAEGTAELPLPPGSYQVQVETWGAGPVNPIDFEIDPDGDDVTTVAIELPARAELRFSVTALDGEGEPHPTPAKIDVYQPAWARLFTLDGQAVHRGPPGTYRVVISRGEEYSAVELTGLEVAAGQVRDINAQIERLWDTDGLISGEFHQHCTRSPDSLVAERDRLMSNIVEGVDFVVPSDHDAITDFTPLIESLDAEDLIYAMPSSEVTTLNYHFNPMPLTYDRALPSGGYFPITWVIDDFTYERRLFPEMVEDLRENWGVEIVQINHPRRSSGYFDATGYDPLLGPDALSDSSLFTTDFDAVEVFNARGDFCKVTRDWLSFVARGYRVAGVGNSDTHSLGNEAGYPRNYLRSTANSASEITDRVILDALLALDVSVSGGALITFPGGPRPGQNLTVTSPTFDLPIRVQTPEWAKIDQLLVIVDGTIVESMPIDISAAQVVAFDQTLTLDTPARDTYLVVVGYGTTRMPIVTPGDYPFGFTNPIFLDLDGDGWTPPGIASGADLPELDIPWCD